jgi:hypothetical protein
MSPKSPGWCHEPASATKTLAMIAFSMICLSIAAIPQKNRVEAQNRQWIEIPIKEKLLESRRTATEHFSH